MNLKIKKERGITLIALIVTIIVLIILATVSINTVFGEDGIIARAEAAKEQTEMAQIKEEAEMVKASLQMDVYEGKIEELNKSNLITEINEHFEGSTLDGENVVVSNGKYSIVIGDDLSIEVIKNGEISGDTGSGDNSGSGDSGSEEGTEEPTGTIDIAYEIEELDENTKVINLSYSGDIRERATEDYENVLKGIIGETMFEYFKEIYQEEVQNGDVTYDELLLEGIANENGMPFESDARAEARQAASEAGMTYKQFLEMVITQKMGIELPSPVTVQVILGDEVVSTSASILYAKSNGTYKIIATTEEGARGETEIEVTGITDEKFSQIYAASADYVDSLGNKARIPAGFAVGTSSDINSIDKGLVITDSVDENGYSNGNEYVWIPVSNINGDGSNKIKVKNTDGTVKEVEITLGRYAFDTTIGVPTKIQYGSEYEDETELKISSTDTYGYKELKDFKESVDSSSDATKAINETTKDLAGFIESVETNGGFFMARYEASYDSGNSIEDYKLASKISTTAIDDRDAALTKGKLWNYITQGDMAKVCKNMYTESNYSDVEADLVNSYAWDTAIVFIQNCSGNSNYANANNSGMALYQNTGNTGDLVCNVYDMAGNLYEWTTEYCTDDTYVNGRPCVYRGGISGDGTTQKRSHCADFSTNVISGRLLLYNSNTGT